MVDGSNGTQESDGVGGGLVGTFGIIALGLYLVSGALFTAYSLVVLWPDEPGGTGSGVGVPSYLGIHLNWSLQRITILIVLFSGALGGLVHALRSYFWYVGSRELKWSWLPMYLLLPFTGAMLGLIFYIVLVAGLFAGAPGPNGKLSGFAAIAALVGMFSTPAALKLQEIFETIFAKRQQGKDAVPVESPAPVVKKVTVTAVPGGAGQTLSVEGTDFQAPLTVNVANSAGATTPVTAKNVTSTTFEADVALVAGTWSLTVAVKDGKAAQPVAFTV